MPEWKKKIFVNAIFARMQTEQREAMDIIQEYNKLFGSEKEEILEQIKR